MTENEYRFWSTTQVSFGLGSVHSPGFVRDARIRLSTPDMGVVMRSGIQFTGCIFDNAPPSIPLVDNDGTFDVILNNCVG